MPNGAFPVDATSSPKRAVLRAAMVAAGFAAVLAALLILWSGTARAQTEDDQRFDNQYCLGCHGSPGMTATLDNGDVLDLHVPPDVFDASVHGELELPCVLCHTSISGFPHDPITVGSAREWTFASNEVCANCHYAQFSETADNVHHDAWINGNLEAATCTDCHGAHDANAPEPRSPEIPKTCQQCHSEIYYLYSQSVHGQALVVENHDVPTCTDCHGVHTLDGPAPDSPFHLFSPQVCATCHADKELMDEYGISTNVFESYIADFHGSTVVLFEELAPDQDTNKPVCIDCHGVHSIKAADDPSSSVFRQNLLQTCQRCHPDAEANFPTSWMSHYSPEPGQNTIVWLVQGFYRILIPAVIGGMALLVLVDAARRIRARRRARGLV